jgi:hypothetical protein
MRASGRSDEADFHRHIVYKAQGFDPISAKIILRYGVILLELTGRFSTHIL